jgi:hypothetical protein
MSKEQSTWIKALAYIQTHKYRWHPFKSPASPFRKYWQPTEVHSEGNGKIEILCVGEDPEYQKAWLEDRGEGVAEKALTAVTGNRIEVEYVLKGE